MQSNIDELKVYFSEKLERSKKALDALESCTQQQVDSYCRACAKAVYDHGEELAADAITETRMGVYEDKVAKNKNKAKIIWDSLKGKKSVGVLDEDPETGIIRIAKPVGVVGAITPVTNPIVTCMSNAMFAIKCRNPVIIAPHPHALKCCIKTVDYMNEALERLGAPENTIQILDIPSMDLTQMMMRAVDVVIATGGMGMVHAVYASGKPAFGVGAGNVQALLDENIDLEDALKKILYSRAFDNGIICAAEQSVHISARDYDRALEILDCLACVVPAEKDQELKELLLPDGKLNKTMVGQTAQTIGQRCGLSIPDGKKVLVVQAKDMQDLWGEEKMFPVIALYAYETWEQGVSQAQQNLNKIGKGHSVVVHSENREHILYAAEHCQVSRVVCNQPCATTAGGSFQNGLNPTNTLGCGSWGNNSISENLTYYHMMNITRVAPFLKDKRVPTDEEVWAE